MADKLLETLMDFQTLMRPRTFVLGLKFLEKVEDLEKIWGVSRLGHRFFFGQALTLARTRGWTISAVPAPNDFWCPLTGYGGFMPMPGIDGSDEDYNRCGEAVNYWVKTKEDAKKRFDAMAKLPQGKYKAMVVGPLHLRNFEPDVILFYGTPAQMCVLSNGLQYEDFERLAFYSIGEAACTDSIIQCFNTKKPALAIPCIGERLVGGVAEDELDMAMTPDNFEKATKGLAWLSSHGLRYPVARGDPMVSPGPDFFERIYNLRPERVPLTPADVAE